MSGPSLDADGNPKRSLGTLLAGEEQPESAFQSKLRVTEDWKVEVVTTTGSDVTVHAGPGRFGRIYNHGGATATVVFKDDGVTLFTLELADEEKSDFPLGLRAETQLEIQTDVQPVALMYREGELS